MSSWPDDKPLGVKPKEDIQFPGKKPGRMVRWRADQVRAVPVGDYELLGRAMEWVSEGRAEFCEAPAKKAHVSGKARLGG